MESTLVSLELTTRSVPPISPVDLNTGEFPALWRGADISFRIGIFDRNKVSVDLSNLAFLEVDIFPLPIPSRQPDTNLAYAAYSYLPYPSAPPAPLLSATIAAEDITTTINRQGWLNGFEENAVATFGWVDTLGLNLGGFPSKQFGMVVHGITTAGRKITYGGGPITVYEAGEQGVYLPNTIAPLVVPEGTIFLIPENAQILFSAPIYIAGDMIVDGYLIEVGTEIPTGEPIVDNDGNAIVDNDGNPIVD